ncbi:MAG: complexin-2 [Eubacterium sp.]|nr:complexin-2 [Eubacterium sp.]
MKQVKISMDLFMELIHYHLAGDESGREKIEKELTRKINSLAQHENYTRSIMSGTEEEKQSYKERYNRYKKYDSLVR